MASGKALNGAALGLLLSLSLAAASQAQTVPQAERTISAFPILMYDQDIGVGYGGTAKTVNFLNWNESLDLVLFNSTKGERWYFFAFSRPDLEVRQGRRYGLAVDFRAESDTFIKYYFYGLGPDSTRLGDNLDSCATFRRQELALTLGRGFSSVFSVEAAYVLRQYKTYDVAPDRPFTEILAVQGSRFAPFLSVVMRFDTSDSRIDPRRGFSVLLQNDFAGRLSGSRTSFHRWTLDLRSYVGVIRKRVVLAARGLVQQISGSDLPVWELSSLGGGAPQSAMRGYVLNRFLDKGKFLACGEVRLPVWKRVGAVVFAEAGLVWPSWKAISFRRTAFDAGFGLRYRLSNFVARGDIGFSREGAGVYFNFGHLF